MRRTLIASLVVMMAALAAPATGAGLASPGGDNPGRGHGDTFEPGSDVHAKIVKKGPAANKTANEGAKVGQVRTWLALDDVAGGFYTKNFKLRGKGKHIEVWTATGTRTLNGVTGTDLNFQEGDCRNGLRTTVTKEQIDYLVGQFDNTIYPIESAAFSVPPKRNGVKSTATAALGVPPGYYAGDGDDIVVLVDNVRDDNYYDLNNTQGFSYIAGFFSSGLNGFFDRNIMTIDAFDWLHRTGQNPPNEPGAREQLHERTGAPFALRGRVRTRVPAPASVVRGPGRGHMDQRGDFGHGDRADGVRRPGGADRRSALRLAHPVLPREQRGPDRREPEPQTGWSGELSERLG